MDLYFRTKDNGATVYRVSEQSRQRRTELQPIAEANVRNGEIKPRKETTLSEAERAEVTAWLDSRRAQLSAREVEDTRAVAESLHSAANWFSGHPDPKAAEAMADDLLMAMHDLRSAIIRFRAKAAKGKG